MSPRAPVNFLKSPLPFILLGSILLFNLAPFLHFAGETFAANYYIDGSKGTNSNPGTEDLPLKTISAGVSKAFAGDTVWIFSGTYRETINLVRGGSGPADPIAIRSMPDAEVHIKGSDLVSAWAPHAGSIWKRDNWGVNSQQVFVDGVPLQQIGEGSPFHTTLFDGKPILKPTGLGLSDMGPGTFWYNLPEKVLYVWLPDGSDPNLHTVEASTRNWIIPPKELSYIELTGLEFAHSNQTSIGQGAGIVNAWGRSWIISKCSFVFGDFAGLEILGEEHTLTDNSFNFNGALGIYIQGSGPAYEWKSHLPTRPPQNITLRRNETNFNNYRHFNYYWGAGGLKAIPSCNKILVSEHKAMSNYGPGIWFDGWCQNIEINRCISKNNQGAGIFFEISDYAIISNNLVVGNKAQGIYIAASNSANVYNNTVVENWAGIVVHGMPRSEHPALCNNAVKNNIISDSIQADLVVYVDPLNPCSNTSDYNLYFQQVGTVKISWTTNSGYAINHSNLNSLTTQTGQESHSMIADPLWSNRSLGDYSLTQGSPAIDAGAEVQGIGNQDLLGQDRIKAGLQSGQPSIDIGAYEYQQISPVNISPPKNLRVTF